MKFKTFSNLDFLITKKVDFTSKIMRKVLSEICCETRRKLNQKQIANNLDKVQNGDSLIRISTTMTRSFTVSSINSNEN